MALGTNNNEATYNNKYLKLVAEVGPTTTRPHLELKEKNEATGKYELTGQAFSSLSGVVKSIKTTHNGKEGRQEVKGFSLFLEDGDERYFIDATMTNASKDLANMALTNIGNKINISVYLNKAGYPSISAKLEDGAYAKGLMSYPLDKAALWNAIKEQEYVPQEEKSDEIDISDVPFN